MGIFIGDINYTQLKYIKRLNIIYFHFSYMSLIIILIIVLITTTNTYEG